MKDVIRRFDFRQISVSIALLALFTTAACSGANPGGVFSVRNSPVQGGPNVNYNGTNNANSSNNAPGGGDSGNGGPQASIPAPTLKKEFILTYTPDENTNPDSNDVPVVGYNNPAECQANQPADSCAAVDCPTGQNCVVVVSTQPIPSAYLNQSVETRFARGNSRLRDFLIPRAIAQAGPRTSLADLCDQTDVYGCCNVAANGGFECFAPQTNASHSTIHIAAFETTTFGNDTDTDNVNPNIFYFGEAPKAISAQGGQAFALTQDGTVVELSDASGAGLRVQRDRQANYAAFTNAQTPTVALANNVLATMNPIPNQNGGIGQRPVSRTIGSETITTNPAAEEYVVLKRSTDGKLRYGIKTNNLGNNRRIGAIYSTTNNQLDEIRFRTSNDTNVQTDPDYIPPHYQTLAFDVNSNNCAVILYESDNNGNRSNKAYLITSCMIMVGSSPTYSRTLVVQEVLTQAPGDNLLSPDNFDLFTFADTTNGSGKALLFNKVERRLYELQYNTRAVNRPLTQNLQQVPSIAVGAVNGNMILNTTKTRAYVTNSNSNELLSIDLTRSNIRLTGSTELTAMVIPNKSLPLGPGVVDYRPVTSNVGQILMGGNEIFGGFYIDSNQVFENPILLPRPQPGLNPTTNIGIQRLP